MQKMYMLLLLIYYKSSLLVNHHLMEGPLPAIFQEGCLITVLMCHFLEKGRHCGVCVLGMTYPVLGP